MQMDKGEILRSYEGAKDKRAQVGILAELNAVPIERIVEILIEQGVDGRTLPHPRRPKKQEQPKESMRSVTEHLEVLITALQLYKKQNENDLEAAVNKCTLTATRIDAALAFVREACAR